MGGCAKADKRLRRAVFGLPVQADGFHGLSLINMNKRERVK
jgi:hypothetical protein